MRLTERQAQVLQLLQSNSDSSGKVTATRACLAKQLGISQATFSAHLDSLRNRNIVTRQDGIVTIYLRAGMPIDGFETSEAARTAAVLNEEQDAERRRHLDEETDRQRRKYDLDVAVRALNSSTQESRMQLDELYKDLDRICNDPKAPGILISVSHLVQRIVLGVANSLRIQERNFGEFGTLDKDAATRIDINIKPW